MVYRLSDRLGNQMFQFAHIYTKIVNDEDKEYSINVLPVSVNKLQYKPTTFINGGIWLGYNESEQYFDKNLIRKIYSPSESEKGYIKLKYGDLSNSLFIQVRRGDFYGLRYWFICLKANFYEDMYKMLTKNHTYDKIFLTSDDIPWCKANIRIDSDKLVYLENETLQNTIYLGSLCKDFIISNSTFGWWCAWLGESNGGRIICPNNHYKTHYSKESDEMNEIYFPNRWEKQEVEKLGYCE